MIQKSGICHIILGDVAEYTHKFLSLFMAHYNLWLLHFAVDIVYQQDWKSLLWIKVHAEFQEQGAVKMLQDYISVIGLPAVGDRQIFVLPKPLKCSNAVCEAPLTRVCRDACLTGQLLLLVGQSMSGLRARNLQEYREGQTLYCMLLCLLYARHNISERVGFSCYFPSSTSCPEPVLCVPLVLWDKRHNKAKRKRKASLFYMQFEKGVAVLQNKNHRFIYKKGILQNCNMYFFHSADIFSPIPC